jgi:hypothetical protein
LLDLRLRLLILEYGRQKVVRGLATLGDVTLEDLESRLAAISQKGKAPSKDRKPQPSVVELAEVACREHPEVLASVRALAVGFQNRTFLPHLRDVQRFIDGIDPGQPKLRSREAAGPIVLRALCTLTGDELARLAVQNHASGDTDFSVLAQAIMRTQSGKQ